MLGASRFWMVVFLSSAAGSLAQPADRPAKRTHLLQPVLLEVAPTQTNGNPWDTGVGAFARPDPQVTLLRDDARALQETTELLLQATERRMAELGRPIPPKFREFFARNALQSVRCGATIDAMQDQPLQAARGKFAADTAVAGDSLLAKLADGGLQVSLGDKIAIFVNDIDVAAHDLMGQAELEITKELLAKGEVELKFNSVESLRLKISPLSK